MHQTDGMRNFSAGRRYYGVVDRSGRCGSCGGHIRPWPGDPVSVGRLITLTAAFPVSKFRLDAATSVAVSIMAACGLRALTDRRIRA